MATTYAHPSHDRAADLLGSLLGREVLLREEDPEPMAGHAGLYVAVYDDADGNVGALLGCDVVLSAYMGAALSLIPKGIAAESAASGSLAANLEENFREVVNVAASLFNHTGRPRLKLRELVRGDALPEDAATMEGGAEHKASFRAEVDGYGNGHMAMVVA